MSNIVKFKVFDICLDDKNKLLIPCSTPVDARDDKDSKEYFDDLNNFIRTTKNKYRLIDSNKISLPDPLNIPLTISALGPPGSGTTTARFRFLESGKLETRIADTSSWAISSLRWHSDVATPSSDNSLDTVATAWLDDNPGVSGYRFRSLSAVSSGDIEDSFSPTNTVTTVGNMYSGTGSLGNFSITATGAGTFIVTWEVEITGIDETGTVLTATQQVIRDFQLEYEKFI